MTTYLTRHIKIVGHLQMRLNGSFRRIICSSYDSCRKINYVIDILACQDKYRPGALGSSFLVAKPAV